MKECQQRGIRVLEWNRIVLLPIAILSVTIGFLTNMNIVSLILAFVGGVCLSLLAVWQWMNGRWWQGLVIGVAAGSAAGIPLLVVPNYNIQPFIQLLVSFVWVYFGASLALFTFREKFNQLIKKGI